MAATRAELVEHVFASGQPLVLHRYVTFMGAWRISSDHLHKACMHVLRSTYLPAYNTSLRTSHSSDPFPLQAPDASGGGTAVLPSQQRETAVLDLFIALKVREDVLADESDLHLGREEAFRDLFDLMQPRARLEDLVRDYGVRAGVINMDSAVRSSRTIPFSVLSVSLSPRTVGLLMSAGTSGRKRTIVEVSRSKDEKLEAVAKKLVRELRDRLQRRDL